MMNKKVKLAAELRHTRRRKGIVLVNMVVTSLLLAAGASLYAHESKRASGIMTLGALCALGVGGVWGYRLERKEEGIHRQLAACQHEKE